MFLTFLLLITVPLALIYLNGKYQENYWRRRGAAYDTGNKYLGPMFEFVATKLSMHEILQRIYDSFPNAPAIGLPHFFSHIVVVYDTTNIQHVLASDFHSFNDRGFEINDGDLLADNVLFMKGNRWKLVRQHLTPLFTTAKLKNMYYIMEKSAKDFVEYLKKNPQYMHMDTFKTLSTFCCGAISASVFGVGPKSIFESPFLEMAKDGTAKIKFAFTLSSLSPTLSKFLGIKYFKKHQDFFIGAVKKVIRAREQDNVKRHDFPDLCVSLQSNGMLIDRDTGLKIKPTDELLAAQAFFLFLAGVEPSAETILGALVELGRNPDSLRTLHEDIDRTFENYPEISYEVVSNIKYLDNVINESLRLHPPFSIISRKCTKDTVLPVGNIKISKGTHVLIPVYQLHHDPKYYPDPETFMPERFVKQKQNILDLTYMPFGRGNRICIGGRFAYLQMKIGMVYLLRHYTVKIILKGNKVNYKKDVIQMRISNADVEFVPRNI